MKTKITTIITLFFVGALLSNRASAQQFQYMGSSSKNVIIDGHNWIDLKPNSDYGGVYLCNKNWNFRFAVENDYSRAFNHLEIRNSKDLILRGGDIWMKKNGTPSGRLIIENGGSIELRGAQIKSDRLMSFRADYDGSGDNRYCFLDNSNQEFVHFNGINKTATFQNVQINGELTFSTSRIVTNNSLTFQIGNTTNSSFAIENPTGTKLLYANLQGNVGIGTTTPSEKLEVDGKIKADSFIADASSFPDYVFAQNYELKPLSEVKNFVKTNYHLPGIPSEKEVIENGLDIKDITVKAIEKIEELHLYIFELEERIKELESTN